MKFLSNKEMNKIAKSTLALVLAGTFTFSTTNAFANESDKTVNEEAYQTVELTTSVTEDTTVKNNLNEEATIENNEEMVETAAPSLVPGSFFYFAKLAFEKIKLAFTFNKEKEAKILAEYAAERLAEADVLLKNGKEQEATELIEKAIENISNVDSLVEEKSDTTEQSDNTEVKNPTVEDEANKDDGEVDIVFNDKEDSFNEVNELLSQNIIALKAALEKVENPVARAALQKNIEKSYAKLAKKIAKIEKKYELNKDEEVDLNELEMKEEKSSIEVEESVSEEENNNETTVVVPVVPTKEMKHELKEQRKADHEQAKLNRELAKKAEKAKREEVKQEEKAKREESKQQWKELKEKQKQEREEFKHNLKHKDDEHKAKHDEEKDNHGKHSGNN